MHYDASILLVYDYEFIRTTLERMLQQLGYQNLCMAADGVDALHLLRTQPIDLVITDYHMPEMDGIEATRKIRSEEMRTGVQRSPILALTADAEEKTFDRILSSGMDNRILKPFDPPALKDILGKAMIQFMANAS